MESSKIISECFALVNIAINRLLDLSGEFDEEAKDIIRIYAKKDYQVLPDNELIKWINALNNKDLAFKVSQDLRSCLDELVKLKF